MEKTVDALLDAEDDLEEDYTLNNEEEDKLLQDEALSEELDDSEDIIDLDAEEYFDDTLEGSKSMNDTGNNEQNISVVQNERRISPVHFAKKVEVVKEKAVPFTRKHSTPFTKTANRGRGKFLNKGNFHNKKTENKILFNPNFKGNNNVRVRNLNKEVKSNTNIPNRGNLQVWKQPTAHVSPFLPNNLAAHTQFVQQVRPTVINRFEANYSSYQEDSVSYVPNFIQDRDVFVRQNNPYSHPIITSNVPQQVMTQQILNQPNGYPNQFLCNPVQNGFNLGPAVSIQPTFNALPQYVLTNYPLQQQQPISVQQNYVPYENSTFNNQMCNQQTFIDTNADAKRNFQKRRSFGYETHRKRRVDTGNLQVVATVDECDRVATNAIEKMQVGVEEVDTEYMNKIEQQKKLREQILKQKEERRKLKAATEVRVETVEQHPQNFKVKVQGSVRNTKQQMNAPSEKRIVCIKNKNNAADKTLPNDFLSNRTVLVKDQALINTPVVVIKNMSADTKEEHLRKMCSGIGEIQVRMEY